MKRILFFLFVFCAVKYSLAQSLTPDVISPAGKSFANGPYQLDWTLGEPATNTLTDGSYLLTQGFHQNNLTITSIDNLESSQELEIFPNPTVDIIQIQSRIKHNENYSIELYTIEGKLLSTQTFNFNALSQIDMSNYSSGTYFLKIKNKNSNVKSYQIVKLK